MKNPDVKALRDENTMMISEIHKKDRIIDELRAQNQYMGVCCITRLGQYKIPQQGQNIYTEKAKDHESL